MSKCHTAQSKVCTAGTAILQKPGDQKSRGVVEVFREEVRKSSGDNDRLCNGHWNCLRTRVLLTRFFCAVTAKKT